MENWLIGRSCKEGCKNSNNGPPLKHTTRGSKEGWSEKNYNSEAQTRRWKRYIFPGSHSPSPNKCFKGPLFLEPVAKPYSKHRLMNFLWMECIAWRAACPVNFGNSLGTGLTTAKMCAFHERPSEKILKTCVTGRHGGYHASLWRCCRPQYHGSGILIKSPSLLPWDPWEDRRRRMGAT